MIYHSYRKPKLKEAACIKGRGKRLNEWRRSLYITHYGGVLEGLDILHLDGDEFLFTTVEDEEWWEELCDANDYDYNKNLDAVGTPPGDEHYHPEYPMYSKEKIEQIKWEFAVDELEEDISLIDSVIKDIPINKFVQKYFENSADSDWFELHKEYGDDRGNQVEWVFDVDELESHIEEISEELGISEDEVRDKIFNCCKEITQYVRDNSFAELDEYVRY